MFLTKEVVSQNGEITENQFVESLSNIYPKMNKEAKLHLFMLYDVKNLKKFNVREFLW